MKILIVSRFYPPDGSPRSIQMSRVVDALINHKGCEVLVLAGLPFGSKPVDFGYPVEYVEYESYTKLDEMGIVKRVKIKRQNIKRKAKWIKAAEKTGLKILENYKPDLLMSASTPMDCHYVAMELIKRHPLPWATFFSDITPSSIAPTPYTPSLKRLRFLELQRQERKAKQVLAKSDAVIMTNRLATDYMSKKLKVNIFHKSCAIPHIGNLPAVSASSTITPDLLRGRILHLGLLDRARHCSELIDAARIVHKEMPEKFRGITFVGDVSQAFINLTTPQERESLFVFTGQVKPSLASAYTSQAESLLIIEADMEMSPYLPSKMAESAVSEKDIIAITPTQSPIREYIQEYGGGLCVSRNAHEIAKAIRQAFGLIQKTKNPACRSI